MNIFLLIILNICFGCSKQLSHWDCSLEYPHNMFSLRNKKKYIFFKYALLSEGLRDLLQVDINLQILMSLAQTWHPLLPCQDQWRGGGGTGGSGSPLKNHKNIGFLSKNGLDPLKITKISSQHSMLGHHRHASDDGPLIVVFGTSLSSLTK